MEEKKIKVADGVFIKAGRAVGVSGALRMSVDGLANATPASFGMSRERCIALARKLNDMFDLDLVEDLQKMEEAINKDSFIKVASKAVDKVGKIVSQQGERIESVIDSLIANEMEAKDEPHSQQAEAADYKEPLCPIWTPEELIETYSNLAASIQQFVNIETGNLNPEHLSKLIETKVIKTIFESYGSGSLENTLYVKFKTIQSVRRSGGINGGKNEIEEIPIAEVYTY